MDISAVETDYSHTDHEMIAVEPRFGGYGLNGNKECNQIPNSRSRMHCNNFNYMP